MVTKTEETADCETDRTLAKTLMLEEPLIIYIASFWVYRPIQAFVMYSGGFSTGKMQMTAL